MVLLNKLTKLPIATVTRLTAVLAVAIAAGHLVQTISARKPAVVVADAAALPTHIVQLSSGGDSAWKAPPPLAELHVLTVEKPNTMPTCVVDLSLTSQPLGMVSVALTAPCHHGQRVVLHQAALAITGKVGLDGNLKMTLPALTSEGEVSVMFADGTRVQQTLAMPEISGLRRFAVQWQGADAFMLHALEGGADFDKPGDISGHNPSGAGFVTVLGDSDVENPLLAEVYTYPDSSLATPQIVLVAAVLPDTCGHDLLGEVLTSQAGQVQSTDLTLAMPDCSGVGDFLVLKDLASDPKIAAN